MSDNIPFEIQMEIIKWLPVKPLIQFRSVSKQWKSFIDSSKFIKGYGARHTQPHSHILGYLSYKKDYYYNEEKYIYLVDDENETFKVQELAPFVVSPSLKQYYLQSLVGACHGLLCLSGDTIRDHTKRMVVIWNPSIQKSFGIVVPNYHSHTYTIFGFGVCPVTRDPTVVKVSCVLYLFWDVEVFTLSSGVWNAIPDSNLQLRHSIIIMPYQVLIDRFIYWAAYEETFTDDGESTTNHMVVSFDLITKEFKVVDLPHSLTNELNEARVFISKLRDSLVVYGSIYVDGAECCGVWVMEHDSSFRKLFTIGAPVIYIIGFRKSGELIFQAQKGDGMFTTLNVYDPCSQQIKNLGISGGMFNVFMCSYTESLLLLDHLDSHIYNNNN